MPLLGGVIHAAGVLDDGVLVKQSWTRFYNVMAPKVAGSWSVNLKLFLNLLTSVCSSPLGASVLGSPGQGNHAAANAFLDALAHDRSAQGYPTISINWGAWAEMGR